jgi:rhomboid protease GluP
VGVTSPSPSPPKRPPNPIYTPPVDDGRIVPPGWLEQAPVTVGLIGLNVCAFLLEVAMSHSVAEISIGASLALGASYWPATLHEGRFETLVTACFLHGGIVHLLFNMLALWQGGPLVERLVGSARMAPMYLVSGVSGYVLSVGYGAFAQAPERTSLGASGAIVGLFGAALVVCWRLGGWRDPMTQAIARWLLFVIGFGVVMNTMGGNIDNAAHVGGALSGAAIATLWKRGAHRSPATTRAVVAACGFVFATCAAVVAVRDHQDRFATMRLRERYEFTVSALSDDRCEDARSGLLAMERFHTKVVRDDVLRSQVEAQCGPTSAR